MDVTQKLTFVNKKNLYLILSVVTIVLVGIVSTLAYKAYLVSSLAEKLFKMILSKEAYETSDFDEADKIVFITKMKDFLKKQNIKTLRVMNNFSETQWKKIMEPGKITAKDLGL